MTIREVADQLVAHCRAHETMQAIDSLYSADIVSVEATPTPDGTKEMKGIDAVKGKAQWWQGAHEVHNAGVEGPLVSGNRFCVRFVYDITFKQTSRRYTLDELAIYTVKDGKIVREEFFYGE